MEKKHLEKQFSGEADEETQKKSLSFVVRLACVLFSLIAIVYISIIGKSVLVPLIIGFLMAMLMLPFSNFQERRLKFPRIASSLISSIVFSLIILAVFFLIGTQVAHFQEDWPEFKEQIINLFRDAQVFVYDRFEISEEEQMQYLSKNAEGVLKRGSGAVGTILGFVTSISASAMFTFLAIFFFLLYRSHLVKFIVWCFPPKEGKRVKFVVSEIQAIIKQYILGLMIQVVLVSGLMFIAYSIIGIKYALLFAILCGVLNLIPYIGVFSATVLAAVVTLATGEPIQALWECFWQFRYWQFSKLFLTMWMVCVLMDLCLEKTMRPRHCLKNTTTGIFTVKSHQTMSCPKLYKPKNKTEMKVLIPTKKLLLKKNKKIKTTVFKPCQSSKL